MLPRSQRMSAEQMDEVMKKGRIFHSPLLIIRALPGTTETKISVVAPKKLFNKAVSRNYIKRKSYAAVRPFVGTFTLPAHVAIFTKSAADRRSTKEISESIRALFVKAGLLR